MNSKTKRFIDGIYRRAWLPQPCLLNAVRCEKRAHAVCSKADACSGMEGQSQVSSSGETVTLDTS
jgi:hypothetical protein